MDNEKATEQIMIRVTKDFKARLNAEAKGQNRPLANYVKAILNEHIDALDRAKKIAERK